MLRWLALLLLLTGIHQVFAQNLEMRVVGTGTIESGTIISRQKVDINGMPVAGIRIITTLQGLTFDSNNGIVGSVESGPGYYLLYLSTTERKIKVFSPNHKPLDIILPDVGIRLKAQEVWRLEITGDRKIEAIPVTIRTKPADAVRFIDGENKGTAETIPLELGKHKLRLERQGYKTLEKEIEVTATQVFFEEMLKEIDPVLVTVKSIPPGATLLVDGVEHGKSDCQLFLFPGTYKVKAQLSGYVEQEQEITVTETGKNEMIFRLEKHAATLQLTITPADARVFVNKSLLTNYQNADLAPGMYRLEIQADGHEPYSEMVTLRRGEILTKTIILTAITGGLQVVVKPIEAMVVLRKDSREVQRWTGAKLLKDLPIGNYELEVSAAGHATKMETITVTQGRIVPVHVDLVKEVATTISTAAVGTAIASTTYTNSIGMEFVLIPAGTFQMGSNDGDSDEKPVHSVTISKPFYLGKYEVTQKEWVSVMGSNPSRFKGDSRPVENVSWNDVQEFIKKLNAKEGGYKYRLPTEAEWEYAARAGSKGKWHFGDNESKLDEYAWYDANSGNETKPVGQKKPNAFGLYDMHGNVWEWCQDWYGSYESGNQTDPQGPASGLRRVSRGGSWRGSGSSTRAAFRYYGNLGYGYGTVGFRLLRLQ